MGARCRMIVTALGLTVGLLGNDQLPPQLAYARTASDAELVGLVRLSRRDPSPPVSQGRMALTDRGRRDALDQGGNTCATAPDLGWIVPQTTSGTTVGYSNDFSTVGLGGLAPSCWSGPYNQTQSAAGPDVCYRFTAPISANYDFNLCASAFDCAMLIYDFVCPPVNPGDFICGNDDYCSLQARTPSVTLSSGQEVLIVVDGYGTAQGSYTLTISYSEQQNCVPSACAATPETDNTGGCLEPPFEAQVIACGDTICGTAWTQGDTLRDTDWYSVTVVDSSVFTWAAEGESPLDLLLFVINGSCNIIASSDTAICSESITTSCLPPGTYYFWAGHYTFGGVPTPADYTASLTCTPCGIGTPLYTIPEVYQNLDVLDGQFVGILCYTTDSTASLLVDDYARYSEDWPMPDSFYVQVTDGAVPDSLKDGWQVAAYGRVSVDTLREPGSNATLDLAMLFSVAAPFTPVDSPWVPVSWEAPEECDSCKFAMLISGGWDATNNHADYWNNLVDFYCYKRGTGFCPDPGNIRVFYYDGVGRDASVPDSLVDECTEANIQTYLQDLAAKVQACSAAGHASQLEIVVTNHGNEADGGICLRDPETLTGAEIAALIQPLVNAGLTSVDCEFAECFSGALVNGIAQHLDAKKTDVTAASSTDDETPARSKRGKDGYSPWLHAKAQALANGYGLDKAIQIANAVYDSFLTDQGVPDRVGKEQYFKSVALEPCEWEYVQCTPGGLINILWPDPPANSAGNCGNVTVWCQTEEGSFRYLTEWNFNVRGHRQYSGSNNARTIETDSNSTGIYRIHNDSKVGPIRIRVRSQNPLGQLVDARSTTPGNPEIFAGFTLGGRDSSAEEFGDLVAASLTASHDRTSAFDLHQTPRVLGASGVAEFTISYPIPLQNYWWQDMELFLVALDGSSGTVLIQCTGAESPSGNLSIGGPGQYTLPVGAISGTGPHSVTLAVTGHVIVDYWALRTAKSTSIPPDVTNLVIQRVGDDAELFWSPDSVSVSYEIQSATDAAGPWAEIGQTENSSFVDPNAFAVQIRRYYYVIAVGP